MGKYFQHFLKTYFSTADPKEFEQKIFELFSEICSFLGYRKWNIVMWNDLSSNDYKISTYLVKEEDLAELKAILKMMLKRLEIEPTH